MNLRVVCLVVMTLTLGWWDKSLYAQENLDTPVSLQTTEANVRQLLNRIEETNLFGLAYSESYVDLDQLINLHEANPTVRELLEAISQATRTIYEVRGSQIIFRKKGAKLTISGYIRDAFSGESLIGAHVWAPDARQGTSSNAYGFYSLTLPNPTDSVTLVYSFVGHGPQAMSLRLPRDTTVNVGLQDNALLDEVVVTATEADKIQEVTQMSSVSVPIEQIKSMPALLGEVDVLKTLQLLPGVQSGNEGTSGLYVRGGGPDQNLILLDGVPVYNASHLFGFFSVFNADAINNVNLIKGGFPARYGGRLSSVLDISMKEGNMKEFHGEGSLGIVAGKLTLEGPIVKDKTSFIVSGRRTWIDFLTRSLLRSVSDGGGEAGYYFYDLNAKVNHRFSDRNRLYLSAYLGDDRFGARFASTRTERGLTLDNQLGIGLGWGNVTSALRWNHVFNHRLFANFTLTHSRYRFNTANDFDLSRLDSGQVVRNQGYARYTSGIRDVAAKLDFDFVPSSRHYVRYGLSVIRHRFNPGAFGILVDNPTVRFDTTLTTSQHEATEWVAYGEDDWRLSDRVKVNVGVHASGFWVGGTHYASLQPRGAVRYILSDQLALKASYARMTQYIHLLTNAGVGLPTDLWVPATARIPPQQSHQIALGVARMWQGGYEISLEGYYKTMNNVIEYREGASSTGPGSDWQTLVEVGDGWSYGAEWLLQKKTGKTTGWVGYTLAWTRRRFDQLNRGRSFPYKYDRRHDASLVLVHRWKENREFSLTWVYGTGNAITLPHATYAAEETGSLLYEPFDPATFNAEEVAYYGERNSYRMEPFHRLDVSVTFRKQTRWGQRAWILGAYNAYNRKNPYFIYYSSLGDRRRFRQFSLFPIIPSVSYRFEF